MLCAMPPAADANADTSRGARRRARTRAALIEGATAVFARQGVEATAIAEITEAADVGFGSFYNHFSSKEELAEAVLTSVIEAQGAALALATAAVEDPAEVVSIAHRHFVGLARTDPDWARVLVRLDVSLRVATAALGAHARRDLDRGIRGGRFAVADAEVAFWAAGGALLAVMRGVLDGRLGERADVHHAEAVLRMLGLAAAEASEIAARPLPTGRTADGPAG
jgi:AcrR family transcriptional regulator